MILSMTGYGCATCNRDGVSYLIEIRSVNHRYLKLTIRLPELWQHTESVIDKALRERLSRGSLFCALRIRAEDSSTLPPINLQAAQRYVDALAGVELPAGVNATLDLAYLATLPGVFEPPEISDEAIAGQQALVRELTGQACDALTEMRRQEGAALRTAILESCQAVKDHLTHVNARAPYVQDEYRERLRTRVGALMQQGGFELSAESLAREVALFAERCDVTEEIIRLGSHLDQFFELCDRPEPVGRTLEFLAQELLREANTIGSKSNDAQISRHVVEIKGQIDRLKEQVQNVE